MIESKDKEINELKQSLSRFPFQLSKEEQLMSVIFQSDNQEIHSSIICKNTDNFITIENKLYKEYPQYFGKEYYFTVNGKKIERHKNLDENKICNNNIIIIKK